MSAFSDPNGGVFRRAVANKGLLGVLVVVALIAGGVWYYNASTAEKPPKLEWVPTEPVPLFCPECKKATMVEPNVFVKIPRQKRTGEYECPGCKKFLAYVSYGPPTRVVPEETKP